MLDTVAQQSVRFDLAANVKHEGQPGKGIYSVHVQNKVSIVTEGIGTNLVLNDCHQNLHQISSKIPKSKVKKRNE